MPRSRKLDPPIGTRGKAGNQARPRAKPPLGAAVAAGSSVVAAASSGRLRWLGGPTFPAVAELMAVAGVAGLVYLLTLAPTITDRHGGTDGAELATAAFRLGIAHPTGYPVYLLLGHVMTWLPIGEVAYRLNLWSALGGIVAAVGVAGLVRRLVRLGGAAVTGAGALAGCTFAFGPLFWSQAIVTEVITWHLALTVGLTAALDRWQRTGGAGRSGLGLGAIVGLGLAHHRTIVLSLAAAGLAALLVDRRALRPRQWGPAALVALLIAGLAYLYLPLRGAPSPINHWGDLTSPAGFWRHASGADYRYLVGIVPPAQMLGRFPAAIRLLFGQVGLAGLGLLLVGAPVLWRTHRFLAVYLVALGIGATGFAIAYGGENSEVYLLPVVFALMPPLALGAVRLAEVVRHRLRFVPGLSRSPGWLTSLALVLGCFGVPGWLVVRNFTALDLSRNDQLAVELRGRLANAPPRAAIVSTRDRETFALWYVQQVEGRRPDVLVLDPRFAADAAHLATLLDRPLIRLHE